jgi:hypothetical protein
MILLIGHMEKSTYGAKKPGFVHGIFKWPRRYVGIKSTELSRNFTTLQYGGKAA